uniref:Uncharacterized protein n=1 Tax=Aegilops tauschii TaxID=37682 RepID=M8CZ13_AEGTA
MAKVVLLLLLVIQISSVLAAAARPFVGDDGQWLQNGIGMVTQMLGGVKQSGDRNTCEELFFGPFGIQQP